MPFTPQQMMAAVFANLPAKSGRTATQWIALLQTRKLEPRKDAIAWLRAQGLGSVTAMLLWRAARGDGLTAGYSVDQIFTGPKASLRPIYDRIALAAAKLGKDVTLEPRKAAVSIGRAGTQFAQALVPARDRVELWLRLDGFEATDRLESPRSKPGLMTHRLALRAPSEVNAQALRWLRTAYARRG